jgi:hypothetical protein
MAGRRQQLTNRCRALPTLVLFAVVLVVWSRTLFTLGGYFRTRGELEPEDDVVVCENYEICDTEPEPLVYWDPNEPPFCEEDLPMTTVIKYRDWPHQWQ